MKMKESKKHLLKHLQHQKSSFTSNKREFQILQEIIPQLNGKNHVSKTTVIEETVKYIETLQKVLKERLSSPDQNTSSSSTINEGINDSFDNSIIDSISNSSGIDLHQLILSSCLLKAGLKILRRREQRLHLKRIRKSLRQ
ncbi:uncharacterized protein [Lepeophtheirus salmonis]|uniref:uncharacterized protein n=1 Tax=Lepeophtheirus salmonis TaxID=72036 RepID=UPI001AE32E53|nr:uncharacterized protein LOC121114249 [Lepeophtheirus salmonis]